MNIIYTWANAPGQEQEIWRGSRSQRIQGLQQRAKNIKKELTKI